MYGIQVAFDYLSVMLYQAFAFSIAFILSTTTILHVALFSKILYVNFASLICSK